MAQPPALLTYSDLERFAIAIAQSGLFGIKTAPQALALMLIAQAEGRHPALAARDYDVIQGRPAKKAEAMARDFLDAGGKVEWHQLDDTAAIATFSPLTARQRYKAPRSFRSRSSSYPIRPFSFRVTLVVFA